MSLRIWLPLDGDLRNLGTSNPTIVTNNLTENNAGKIGKCILFNGTNSYISITPAILNNDTAEFSYSCWIKPNTLSGTQTLFCNRTSTASTGFSIFIISATTIYFDTGTRWTITVPTLATDQWYHICCTYSRTYGKALYLNGELISSKTSIGSNPTTANTSSTHLCISQTLTSGMVNGYLNDVRIYDHCLSAAEVHEIAQGLVLHYKLDGFMGGTNSNLAQGSRLLATASSLTNCNISKRGSPTIETRTDGFAQVKGTAAWQGFSLWSNSLNLKVNTTYTYSFYGYTALSTSTNAGISFYPMMYNSAGTRDTSSTLPISVMDGTFTNSNAKQIGKLSTTPQLYWATFTWNQTMADIIANGGKIELSIQIHGTFDTGRIDYLWAPKLELGDKPTTWTPSIEEMGIDPTKIEDSSGYNHNAISNGSQPISIDTDTPKYLYSTHFISGSRIAMPVASSTCLPTDAITVSIWYKSSAGTARFLSCTEGGGWNFEVNSSKASFPFYIKGKGYGRVIATQNFYSDNIWHMITASYDGVSTAKIYLDGQLNNTATITSGWENIPLAYNTSTPLTLGAEAQTIASPIAGTYVGSLSDLRIYCTALSDDAVLGLYHTGAKIDNKKNIHSYSFNEINSTKILKTGVMNGSIAENLFTQHLKYDQNVYIEPDGSVWVRAFHHNNPTSNKFASSDTFTTSVYKNADTWFNMEVCNYLNKWEIMVKSRATPDAVEYKYRWIQQYNPMTATYANVAAANVTKVTTDGYTNYSWGGLYKINSNTFLCANNDTSGNWWGAVGAWNAHQGGIPGWTGVITTGYEDVYLRIDNVDWNTPDNAKITKNNIWIGDNFIEL